MWINVSVWAKSTANRAKKKKSLFPIVRMKKVRANSKEDTCWGKLTLAAVASLSHTIFFFFLHCLLSSPFIVLDFHFTMFSSHDSSFKNLMWICVLLNMFLVPTNKSFLNMLTFVYQVLEIHFCLFLCSNYNFSQAWRIYLLHHWKCFLSFQKETIDSVASLVSIPEKQPPVKILSGKEWGGNDATIL